MRPAAGDDLTCIVDIGSARDARAVTVSAVLFEQSCTIIVSGRLYHVSGEGIEISS